MITIGLDVHVRNSYLHVTDDAGGVIRHGRVHHTMSDLAKFLGPIEHDARQRGEPIHVVLESTTNSRAIQRLLTQYGEAAGIDLTAEVLDARKIRIIAESVCKCDRHVPTGTLAMLAQRLGKVFASPTTWFRLVRLYKWRRPRLRVHPPKPKVGIRASASNEIWHVDTTIIRLLDGTRAYLHAVIDNFSRRILAWKTSATFDPMHHGRTPTPRDEWTGRRETDPPR